MRDKIKEIELEIKRLKKLPDYEYVIMDLEQEKKKLKKAASRKLQATSGLTGPEGYYRMNIMKEYKQLKRIADILAEILRLVKKDMK